MKRTFRISIFIAVISVSIFGQDINVTQISEDVIVLYPEKYRNINEIRKVGGNVTAVKTDSGMVVFDSFISTKAAEIGKDLIHQYFPGIPIKYLIITHHHADHLAGSSIFKNAFTIAYKNLIKHTDVQINLFLASDTLLDIGGKSFEFLYFGNAHTNSDIVILNKTDKLLVMGDLLCYEKCYVLGQESDVQIWINLLDILLKRKSEYQFVIPGHGSIVEDYTSLIEQHDYLLDLYDVVRNAKDKNWSIDEILHSKQLEKYKNYMLFDKIDLDLKVCWEQIDN